MKLRLPALKTINGKYYSNIPKSHIDIQKQSLTTQHIINQHLKSENLPILDNHEIISPLQLLYTIYTKSKRLLKEHNNLINYL